MFWTVCILIVVYLNISFAKWINKPHGFFNFSNLSSSSPLFELKLSRTSCVLESTLITIQKQSSEVATIDPFLFLALKKDSWNQFVLRSVSFASTPDMTEKYRIKCLLNEMHCSPIVSNILVNFDNSKLILEFSEDTNEPLLLSASNLLTSIDFVPNLIGPATSQWVNSRKLEIFVSPEYLSDISYAHSNQLTISVQPKPSPRISLASESEDTSSPLPIRISSSSSFTSSPSSSLSHSLSLPLKFSEHGSYLLFLASPLTRRPVSRLKTLSVDICGDADVIGPLPSILTSSTSSSNSDLSDLSVFDLAMFGEGEQAQVLHSHFPAPLSPSTESLRDVSHPHPISQPPSDPSSFHSPSSTDSKSSVLLVRGGGWGQTGPDSLSPAPPTAVYKLNGLIPLDGKHGLSIPSSALPPSAGGLPHSSSPQTHQWGRGWSLSFWIYLTQEPSSQFRTLFYKGDPSPSSSSPQSRSPSAWFLPHQSRLTLRMSTRPNPSLSLQDQWRSFLLEMNQSTLTPPPLAPPPSSTGLDDTGFETLRDLPSGQWHHLCFSFLNLSHSARMNTRGKFQRVLRNRNQSLNRTQNTSDSSEPNESTADSMNSDNDHLSLVDSLPSNEELDPEVLATSHSLRVLPFPSLSPASLLPSQLPSSSNFPHPSHSESLPPSLSPSPPPFSASRHSSPAEKSSQFVVSVHLNGKLDVKVQYPMFVEGNHHPLSLFADPLLSHPSPLGFARRVEVWDQPLSEKEAFSLYMRGHSAHPTRERERHMRILTGGGRKKKEDSMLSHNLSSTSFPLLSSFSSSPVDFLAKLVGSSDSISAQPSSPSPSSPLIARIFGPIDSEKRVGRRSALRMRVMGGDPTSTSSSTSSSLHSSFPIPPPTSPFSPRFPPSHVSYLDDNEEGYGQEKEILRTLSQRLLERAKSQFSNCNSQPQGEGGIDGDDDFGSFSGPGSRLDLLSLSASLGNPEALSRWGLALGTGVEEPQYTCGRDQKLTGLNEWKKKASDLVSYLWNSLSASFLSSNPSDLPTQAEPLSSSSSSSSISPSIGSGSSLPPLPSLPSILFSSSPIYLDMDGWEGQGGGGRSFRYWRQRIGRWRLGVRIMNNLLIREGLRTRLESNTEEGNGTVRSDSGMVVPALLRLEKEIRRDLSTQNRLSRDRDEELEDRTGQETEDEEEAQSPKAFLPLVSDHLISHLPLIRSLLSLTISLDRGELSGLPFLASSLSHDLGWAAGEELWGEVWMDEGEMEAEVDRLIREATLNNVTDDEVEGSDDEFEINISSFRPPLSLTSLLHVPWPDSFYPSSLSFPALPFQDLTEHSEGWSAGLPLIWHQTRRLISLGRKTCQNAYQEQFSSSSDRNDNDRGLFHLPSTSSSSLCFLPHLNSRISSESSIAINFDPASLLPLSFHYLGALLSLPHSQFILAVKYNKGVPLEEPGGAWEGSGVREEPGRIKPSDKTSGMGTGVFGDVETSLFYAHLAAEVSSVEFHKVGFQPLVETDRLNEQTEDRVQVGNLGDADELIINQRVRAQEGDVDAQVAMGDLLYYGGRGVARDHPAALNYFEQAAQAGSPVGMCGAAGMYLKGEGTEKNASRAETLYKEAASLGSVRALNGLGYMYFYGQGGVEKNESKALGYFLEAANMGEASDADSLFNAGFCLMNGIGISPADPTRAAHYFSVAAMRFGHFDAILSLGRMYSQGLGVVRSPSQALTYLISASQTGPWAAWIRRGFDRYLDGEDERKSSSLYFSVDSLSSNDIPQAQTTPHGSFDSEVEAFARAVSDIKGLGRVQIGHLRALACYLLASEGGSEVASSNAAFILRRRLIPSFSSTSSFVSEYLSVSSLPSLLFQALKKGSSLFKDSMKIALKHLLQSSLYQYISPSLPEAANYLHSLTIEPDPNPFDSTCVSPSEELLESPDLLRLRTLSTQFQSHWASLELRVLAYSRSLGQKESGLWLGVRFFQGLRGLLPIVPSEAIKKSVLLSARSWLSLASSQDLSLASLYLGVMDQFGIGSPRNLVRAVRYFDLALSSPSQPTILKKISDPQELGLVEGLWTSFFASLSPSSTGQGQEEMGAMQVRTWASGMRWVAKQRVLSGGGAMSWWVEALERVLRGAWVPDFTNPL